MFSGTGTNLRTGKELHFQVPPTLSHAGLETIIRKVHVREVQAGGSTYKRPDPFVDEILKRALGGAKNRDAELDKYCDILSRKLKELLLVNGLSEHTAEFKFERIIVNEKISIRPRICVNQEMIQTDEQFDAFMQMVRRDLPVELQDFAHPCDFSRLGPASKA